MECCLFAGLGTRADVYRKHEWNILDLSGPLALLGTAEECLLFWALTCLNYCSMAHGPGELANSRHPAEYLPRQPLGNEILTFRFGDRLAEVLGEDWGKQATSTHWLDSISATVDLSVKPIYTSYTSRVRPLWVLQLGRLWTSSIEAASCNGSKCQTSVEE